MRLERLEISGFKSFSDRSELAFDGGVTAIVGPNGCGKSNVADAITWVLGEQSAKSLRGERMEDVIFSGSDARRPGATAEVRLRLTGVPLPPKPEDQASGVAGLPEFGVNNGNGIGKGNSNGNGHHPDAGDSPVMRAVEVTRRLYRSGESVYLIDGAGCRLRDVHELLMDTGLGAKAYAIIEQGKIGMILSSRPTDRRQLIEEAAGITKYRSRRRTAELKLEAAQQNLTRIDDIVFEVEKQRGALKRQAAKARRYRRLREDLRRWEKVLFARRYRELAAAIDAARARLVDARARETAAAARLAEVEAELGRLRIEQAEADGRAAGKRNETHSFELEVNRRHQQQQFGRHQAETLGLRAEEIALEVANLEARRQPAVVALSASRQAKEAAERARDEAAEMLAGASTAQLRAQQQTESHEGDVEAARSEVFAALSAATALRHAIEHASAQRARVGEALDKLSVEEDDLRREFESVEAARAAAAAGLERVQEARETLAMQCLAREAELVAVRQERDGQMLALRAREQELAGLQARLASLEELQASRAEFGDAARMVLVQANGRVDQQGAVADYLEVDRRYERAVEACLGELLQHVLVEHHAQAAAGLELVRQEDAGRCGFVIIDPDADRDRPREIMHAPAGVTLLSEVLRVVGPHAGTIRQVFPDGYVAESFEQGLAVSRETSVPVATLDGDLFRGPHLVSGGAKVESRGILGTKREIRELRERVERERQALGRTLEEATGLEVAVAQVTSAIASLSAERHRLDVEGVAAQAQIARTADEAARLQRKGEVLSLERRQAEEERAAVDARHAEAQSSLARLEVEQRQADERLSDAQRFLLQARATVDGLATRAAEMRAQHAGLVERASSLALEVHRLEEGALELEARIAGRAAELEHTRTRRRELLDEITAGERALDEGIRALDALREDLRASDEAAAVLRDRVDAQDHVIRGARHALEAVRAEVTEFELGRAAAESDLTHLAQVCADAVQASLDDILIEVEQMEQAGQAVPDHVSIAADEPDSEGDDTEVSQEPATPPPASMTAEEAIARLKTKIERLGPVNMMAIEQFDELETRHVFLTTQRKDLIDSIAQTSEAILRIDQTTKARFKEAFAAIQENFQSTFSTLFGGGRAGLALIDEQDPLDSGIDIVASPPGKRLQSVQLLSGGEKALTAIALMFAIFKYKPSPFCVLDEIDAPLDDANVGRFVDMLSGMLDRTQFILITHNRRTMEIANRLYGVTMEEPGVSKLISVQLN
jgi:chromosome segregation protein